MNIHSGKIKQITFSMSPFYPTTVFHLYKTRAKQNSLYVFLVSSFFFVLLLLLLLLLIRKIYICLYIYVWTRKVLLCSQRSLVFFFLLLLNDDDDDDDDNVISIKEWYLRVVGFYLSVFSLYTIFHFLFSYRNEVIFKYKFI